jgi:hypothetical protein
MPSPTLSLSRDSISLSFSSLGPSAPERPFPHSEQATGGAPSATLATWWRRPSRPYVHVDGRRGFPRVGTADGGVAAFHARVAQATRRCGLPRVVVGGVASPLCNTLNFAPFKIDEN